MATRYQCPDKYCDYTILIDFAGGESIQYATRNQTTPYCTECEDQHPMKPL